MSNIQDNFIRACRQGGIPYLAKPFLSCLDPTNNSLYSNHTTDYQFPVPVPRTRDDNAGPTENVWIMYISEHSSRNSTKPRPYCSWRAQVRGSGKSFPPIGVFFGVHPVLIDQPDVLLADVRMQSNVLQSPFGQKFCNDGLILQKALALSADTGMRIHIVPTHSVPTKKSHKSARPFCYVGQRRDGSTEILGYVS